MPYSHSYFGRNDLQALKDIREQASTGDDQILSLLESLKSSVAPEGPKTAERPVRKGKATFNLSRQLVLPAAQQLQRENLVDLARLYTADQSLADTLSVGLDSLKDTEKDSEQWCSKERAALRQMIMESSDDFAHNLNWVAKPGTRLADGVLTLENEADQILQEFSAICILPNKAEVDMLARVCECRRSDILGWFTMRRLGRNRLVPMEHCVTSSSRLGTKLRKQESSTNKGPTLAPRMPAELYEFI